MTPKLRGSLLWAVAAAILATAGVANASGTHPAAPSCSFDPSTAVTPSNDVGVIGDLRAIARAELNGRTRLTELPGDGPLWALGMPHGLDRELLVEAGRVSSSGFVDHHRFELRHPSDLEVAFLVHARVSDWCSVAVPTNVVDFATLQMFVGTVAKQAGYTAEMPLPFRLRARARALRWFVVGGTGNMTPSPRESFLRARTLGGLHDVSLEALGFFSPRHRGVASNQNSDMHIHFRTTSGPRFVGHLDDDITLEPGAVLLVPLQDGIAVERNARNGPLSKESRRGP